MTEASMNTKPCGNCGHEYHEGKCHASIIHDDTNTGPFSCPCVSYVPSDGPSVEEAKAAVLARWPDFVFDWATQYEDGTAPSFNRGCEGGPTKAESRCFGSEDALWEFWHDRMCKLPQTHICPVCEFSMLHPASDYNICERCGTEFGADDDEQETKEVQWAALRARWIAGGSKFFSPRQEPTSECCEAEIVESANGGWHQCSGCGKDLRLFVPVPASAPAPPETSSATAYGFDLATHLDYPEPKAPVTVQAASLGGFEEWLKLVHPEIVYRLHENRFAQARVELAMEAWQASRTSLPVGELPALDVTEEDKEKAYPRYERGSNAGCLAAQLACRERQLLASQSALAQAEEKIAELENLRDRLIFEAQMWAQEARTQTATVYECYAAGGTTGKATFNGAVPVREAFAQAQAQIVGLVKERDEAYELLRDYTRECDRLQDDDLKLWLKRNEPLDAPPVAAKEDATDGKQP